MFRAVEWIEKAATCVGWSVCLGVTLMIVIDVVGRALLNKPLPATWETSEVLMPFIVFLPFAYTLEVGSHVRVSLFVDRLSEKVRNVLRGFTDLLSIAVCGLLTYYSWKVAWESFLINEEMLAAVTIPWWPGKMAMPVGMALFTLRYAIRFFSRLVKAA